jgi:hypothetical protein
MIGEDSFNPAFFISDLISSNCMPCLSFWFSELNESGLFQFASEAIDDLYSFANGDIGQDISYNDHVE